MIKELHAEIISPTGYIFSGFCYMVVIPGSEGEIGVMANHESIITNLKAGKIVIYDDKQNITNEFEIAGGFVEVMEDRLLALVD